MWDRQPSIGKHRARNCGTKFCYGQKDKNKDTEEFDVKIIAAEKKNEDREVLINGINMPGKAAIFSIEDKTVIIPAKKKSANLRVKIYPKRVTDKAEFRIVCTPKDKEGKKTQITIHLSPQ